LELKPASLEEPLRVAAEAEAVLTQLQRERVAHQ